MSLVMPFLALIVLPGVTAALLLGPLRDASFVRLMRLAAALAGAAGCLAMVAAILVPHDRVRSALAIAVLAAGPVAGTFAALRTEGVRSDRRLAFVLGPLGYLAGAAVAIRVLVGLGFAM